MTVSFNAPLSEYPDYNSRERGKIGALISIRNHLSSLDLDSSRVIARVAALNWALEAIKDITYEVQTEEDHTHFYTLRDRRNYLERLEEEEKDGFLVRECKAIDWIMEELVEGSGHKVDRKKVVPWLVTNKSTEFGEFDAGIVLAESAVEAIELVWTTESVRYPGMDLRQVIITDQVLEATEVTYRKGLIYHNNI